jgi:hypothetical protein
MDRIVGTAGETHAQRMGGSSEALASPAVGSGRGRRSELETNVTNLFGQEGACLAASRSISDERGSVAGSQRHAGDRSLSGCGDCAQRKSRNSQS